MKKEVAKQIHEKAEPFVTWLRTAEEESSEDEEEEVGVEFSSKQTGTTLTVQPEKVRLSTCVGCSNTVYHAHVLSQQAEEVEVDDIDIDDI